MSLQECLWTSCASSRYLTASCSNGSPRRQQYITNATISSSITLRRNGASHNPRSLQKINQKINQNNLNQPKTSQKNHCSNQPNQMTMINRWMKRNNNRYCQNHRPITKAASLRASNLRIQTKRRSKSTRLLSLTTHA